MVDLFGLAYSPQKASTDQTTIVEQVPVDYQPQANPPVFRQGDRRRAAPLLLRRGDARPDDGGPA